MTQHPDPMAAAKAWLDDRDVAFRQLTRYQVKIGKRISYYPTKGTTFVDGEDGARRHSGLSGLEQVLIELGYLAPEHATPSFAPSTLASR